MARRPGRPSHLPLLTDAAPHLAAEWHEKNDRTADEVSVGAKYRALWRCSNVITFRGTEQPCGYEWRNTVVNRARSGQGCPACAGKAAAYWNNLAALHPAIAAEWSSENPCAPDTVTPGSGRSVLWKCVTCAYQWATTPDKRTARHHGCPACSKRGSVAVTQNLSLVCPPSLLQEWHPRNEMAPGAYRPHANVRVWWSCQKVITFEGVERRCGHQWQALIASRVRGSGCPACAGKSAADWNNLAVTHPALCAEWCEANPLIPAQVTAGSKKKVRWRCSTLVSKQGTMEPCGYEWSTAIQNRTAGKGCPACCGHVVTSWNSIAARYPELVAEWAPENTFGPDEVTAGSDYRAVWVCSNRATSTDGRPVVCGQRWKTRPSNRVLGTGCPECLLWATSREEVRLAHEVALFFDVDNSRSRIQGVEKRWMCDIVLPAVRVIVEYDGAYWHRGNEERDIRKTADLTAAGWHVIRVREHPLSLISPFDVPCSRSHPKRTANDVLSRIEEVTGHDIVGLAAYREESAPLNREAADSFAAHQRAAVLANRAERRGRRARAA